MSHCKCSLQNQHAIWPCEPTHFQIYTQTQSTEISTSHVIAKYATYTNLLIRPEICAEYLMGIYGRCMCISEATYETCALKIVWYKVAQVQLHTHKQQMVIAIG